MAERASDLIGSPGAFGIAVAIIVVWGLLGFVVGPSDTWQLVINTGTTIVTFLAVFLIQNTQNREARATQIKLDELIRAMKGAREELVDIEDASDDEMRARLREFSRKTRGLGDERPAGRRRR